MPSITEVGYRIGPFEVEDALLIHFSVLECDAVGSPYSVRGEIVKAFIVLKRGWKPSDAMRAEPQQTGNIPL